MRYLTIALSLLAMTACARPEPTASAPATTAATPPNILFIAVDDLKPTLGCYDDPYAQTPTMDDLAARGVTFTNAHCQQAVCGPSRASLLTGLLPDHIGIHDLKTKIRAKQPDVVTLPQHFKNHGYRTAAVGKIFDKRSVDAKHDAVSWSIPWIVDHDLPFDPAYGAPAMRYYLQPEIQAGCDALIEQHGHKALYDGTALQAGLKPAVERFPAPDSAYLDGIFTTHARSLLAELSSTEQPFFLAIGYNRPHLPFSAPEHQWAKYDNTDFALATYQEAPKNAPGWATQPGWEIRDRKTGYGGVPTDLKTPFSPELQRELIHGYYACTSHIDTVLAELLSDLEQRGLRDNTIIVLWGDHGFHLGDHAQWCKHSNFEQATRVPLIIVDPRYADSAGSRCASPAELLDLFPSLCDLAGIPSPQGLDGVSLEPLLADPNTSVKPVALSQFDRWYGKGKQTQGYAVRDERYRYVRWVPWDAKSDTTSDEVLAEELYDYLTDPLETISLADDPAYAAIKARLATALAQRR
ncbi:MAG: sulfatase [Planctomycetota bacterium]|jgi:arylsulfatase A-like enzyme